MGRRADRRALPGVRHRHLRAAADLSVLLREGDGAALPAAPADQRVAPLRALDPHRAGRDRAEFLRLCIDAHCPPP